MRTTTNGGGGWGPDTRSPGGTRTGSSRTTRGAIPRTTEPPARGGEPGEFRDARGERDGSLAADLVKGAIAGAVGVWAMDRVVWWMWNHEDDAARVQERLARPQGLDPAHVVANRAAELMGHELSPPQPHPAGIAVHYALGVVPGALYGAARRRVPGVAAAGGLLYGLGLFLVEDEGMNPLIGTSGMPGEYPWQAHVRGLVGHLVLGAATHAALEALDAVA